jgi:hypothetical protein
MEDIPNEMKLSAQKSSPLSSPLNVIHVMTTRRSRRQQIGFSSRSQMVLPQVMTFSAEIQGISAGIN